MVEGDVDTTAGGGGNEVDVTEGIMVLVGEVPNMFLVKSIADLARGVDRGSGMELFCRIVAYEIGWLGEFVRVGKRLIKGTEFGGDGLASEAPLFDGLGLELDMTVVLVVLFAFVFGMAIGDEIGAANGEMTPDIVDARARIGGLVGSGGVGELMKEFEEDLGRPEVGLSTGFKNAADKLLTLVVEGAAVGGGIVAALGW